MEPSKEFADTINEAIRKERERNLSKTNTVKTNAAGDDLPARTQKWFDDYFKLVEDGAPGLDMIRGQLTAMFPQFMLGHDIAYGSQGMANPRGADGYLSQPAHNGTSDYTNTQAPGNQRKIQCWDARARKWVLKDVE